MSQNENASRLFFLFYSILRIAQSTNFYNTKMSMYNNEIVNVETAPFQNSQMIIIEQETD